MLHLCENNNAAFIEEKYAEILKKGMVKSPNKKNRHENYSNDDKTIGCDNLDAR